LLTNSGIISSPFPITVLIPTEEWIYKNPASGDHIRVDRGLYNHHGIHISEEEVIHFSSEDDDNLAGTDNMVLQTNLEGFLRGGKLEVKIYTEEEIEDLYHVDAIVSWARACLGDEGYNLVFNNCEHFANYCTLGRHHSHQVSKVVGGGVGMGLFSSIGGFIGSFFGGGGSSRDSSSSTTTYEPDKVRVAEIEASAKIRLAGMEQERIRLYTDSQLELLEFNAKMEAAVIEARIRGEQALQQSMLEIMREVNIIAEQRFKLIETAHFDAIKQIEGYYKDLKNEINQDAEVSIKEKLPALLQILQQFEKGSTEHEIYADDIKQHRSLHFKFIADRVAQLHIRQNQVVQSCITGKEQINSHINLLVETRMEQIGMTLEKREQLQLAGGQPQQQIAEQLRIAEQNAETTI